MDKTLIINSNIFYLPVTFMYWLLTSSLTSMPLLRKALLAFLTVLLFFNSHALGSQENRLKTVLIVYSLGHMYPVMATWDRNIWSVFRTQQDINIKVNTENLDLSLYHDSEYIRRTVDSFRYRYLESKPDLIVAVFEPAFDFVLKYRLALFPDVPIVFGGIERLSFENPDLYPNITGVFQDGTAYGKTLDLALNLHPDTRHIVVIGGAGFIEQSWLEPARKTFQRYVDRFQFTYMIGLSIDEIQNRLKKFPTNTVVLSFPITEDSSGESMIYRDALTQISKTSSVPVYSFYPGAFGKGIVGGYIKNFSVQAKTTAEMGIRVLKGIPIQEIPAIQINDLDYMFDWRQLKRWSIPENRLPPGSIVKFKELTTWDRYRGQIIGALIVILFQTLIIFYLLYQRRIRLRAQEQVLQAELKYRTVADHTFDWEYWQNSDGSLQYVSPSCERICGYTAQDFMKNPSLLQDIIVNEDEKAWAEHRCDHQKEGRSEAILFRIQRPDGEIRWIEHACQPVFDSHGNNKGVRASNRDVTKREFYKSESRQLQSELAHMDRIVTISALTSALAHEINQPLAAMRSYAQAALRFLDKNQPEYDSVRKALQGIVADNKRAAAVVNRLRDLVKKGTVHREVFDINSIINDVIGLMNSEIVLRNASLTLGLHPAVPVVRGDSIQIQQVLINLLTNALDAMDNQPRQNHTITISTRPQNSISAIITISDSGGGIPADKIEAIFAPFHTTKPKGVGLGLAICKSIIEAHGGRIWAANNPEGGAIFSFILPSDER
jgi:PAS domain S-box-containing protein